MTAPNIESSTREERMDYVLNEWKCLHNCELCGKCHVLKGRSEEMLYADYIDGKRSYVDITLEIRGKSEAIDDRQTNKRRDGGGGADDTFVLPEMRREYRAMPKL